MRASASVGALIMFGTVAARDDELAIRSQRAKTQTQENDMTDDLMPAALAPGAPEVIDDDTLDAIGQELEVPDAVASYELANISEAEWAMRSLAKLQQLRADVKEQADAWRAPVDEWQASADGPLARRAEFLHRKLEAFGLRTRAGNPKQATVSLPSGEIATRQQSQPTVIVVDEEALIEWASETLPGLLYEDVVKTTESVRVSELRKHVDVIDETGEGAYDVRYTTPEGEVLTVPGVDVEPPVTTATVKPLR